MRRDAKAVVARRNDDVFILQMFGNLVWRQTGAVFDADDLRFFAFFARTDDFIIFAGQKLAQIIG